jgi:gluconolactonase
MGMPEEKCGGQMTDERRPLHRDFGPNAAPQRYPDPDIVVIDPKRFKAKVGNTAIKRLYTGCLWAEGPAWNAQGQYLVWSDIPNNRQLRYLEDSGGHVSDDFRKPTNEANGNTFDFQGRQITCERTRMVRFEHDGSATVLAERANGKPLNGPNDVVVHPNDGSIWFTDPGYGAIVLYEGQRTTDGSIQPYQKEAVYRIDAQTGEVSKVADDAFKPNGIAFSSDYKKVYICDSGITHYPQTWRSTAGRASRTACASIPRETSGSAPVGSAKDMTACRCLRPMTATGSVKFACRNAVPIFASAARSETVCS